MNVLAGSKALKRRYKFKRRKQRDDAIAAALQEASAQRDIDQARLQQSLMLEALFELLFRVLKQASSSGLLRSGDAASNGIVVRGLTPQRMAEKFPLLYIALEALGKYTHLISLEYFTDVLAVFQQLLSAAAVPLRARLRCLLTVAEIVRAQGDALNVDRRAFYVQLHDALAVCPLEQLQPEAEGNEDSDNDVDLHVTSVAAVRAWREGESLVSKAGCVWNVFKLVWHDDVQWVYCAMRMYMHANADNRARPCRASTPGRSRKSQRPFCWLSAQLRCWQSSRLVTRHAWQLSSSA